jgi:hypothetical protein
MNLVVKPGILALGVSLFILTLTNSGITTEKLNLIAGVYKRLNLIINNYYKIKDYFTP